MNKQIQLEALVGKDGINPSTCKKKRCTSLLMRVIMLLLSNKS